WNFAFDISEALQQYAGVVEVLVIPPDLLDKLKKSGFERGTVRFSSLQYLVCDIDCQKEAYAPEGTETITVKLKDYVLLSPDNVPLDDADKAKLQEVINQDPLSLIEYWSIDPDYDGTTFRSKWQDYRENTENDNDALHCIYSTRMDVPAQEHRTVCVKAVDVFGFESVVTKKIK
ncbi:MAG: site-specific DNA-methyltransferase, partial [Bacteroidales bacterium]|nr:site-specific DNA-methyltransferase [Bacteroidales bacterium]